MMLNRILQNHWCRLVAGNLSVTLLVVGIPVAVLFTLIQSISTTTASLIVLAIVHAALVGLQISKTGTWIPEKWLAVGYAFLPVVDVSRTVSFSANRLTGEAILMFALAVLAAFVTVEIARNQWRKWRSPKSVAVTAKLRQAAVSTNVPVDDPSTMVY